LISCFPFACHGDATLRCSSLLFQRDLQGRLGFQSAAGGLAVARLTWPTSFQLVERGVARGGTRFCASGDAEACPFDNACLTGNSDGQKLPDKAIWFAFAIFVGIFNMNAASSISITSPSFQAGGDIPAKFTCNGTNVSPELQISSVPNEAKSLVLIVDDPDAPRGLLRTGSSGTSIRKRHESPRNSAPPAGVQGINDFGKRNYGGPCPPPGTHRYFSKSSRSTLTGIETQRAPRRTRCCHARSYFGAGRIDGALFTQVNEGSLRLFLRLE